MGIIFGLEDKEANENATPFSIHFHAHMPNSTTKNGVDCSANLEAAVAPANVIIVNPYRKALNLISAFVYTTQGRNYDQFILMCHVHSAHKTDLGRDTEASMSDQKMLQLFSFLQLRIKPLSNEHT